MKYFVLLCFLLVSIMGHAQNRDDLIEQFRSERKAMLERMMKMFKDDFSNHGFFKDDFDPFQGFGSMQTGKGKNIEIKEEYQDNGDIHISIIPLKENAQIEIETKNNQIVIKSETKIEEQTNEGGNTFKSFSSSSFSQSIPIPQGYKVKTTKALKKGAKIILAGDLKMKNLVKPRKSKGKVPLGPQEGEEYL